MQPFVGVIESTVIEHFLDEAHVLPRPIEQDPREREIGDAEQVLPPNTLWEPTLYSPSASCLRQGAEGGSRLDVECKLAKLIQEPLVAAGIGGEVLVELVDSRARVRCEISGQPA